MVDSSGPCCGDRKVKITFCHFASFYTHREDPTNPPFVRVIVVGHCCGPCKGSPGPRQYRVIVVHLCLECSRAADVFAREPMRPRASDPWAHLVARPQLPRTIPGRFQAGPAGAPPGNVSVLMNSPASRREPGLLTAPVRWLGHHTDGRLRA